MARAAQAAVARAQRGGGHGGGGDGGGGLVGALLAPSSRLPSGDCHGQPYRRRATRIRSQRWRRIGRHRGLDGGGGDAGGGDAGGGGGGWLGSGPAARLDFEASWCCRRESSRHVNTSEQVRSRATGDARRSGLACGHSPGPQVALQSRMRSGPDPASLVSDESRPSKRGPPFGARVISCTLTGTRRTAGKADAAANPAFPTTPSHVRECVRADAPLYLQGPTVPVALAGVVRSTRLPHTRQTEQFAEGSVLISTGL